MQTISVWLQKQTATLRLLPSRSVAWEGRMKAVAPGADFVGVRNFVHLKIHLNLEEAHRNQQCPTLEENATGGLLKVGLLQTSAHLSWLQLKPREVCQSRFAPVLGGWQGSTHSPGMGSGMLLALWWCNKCLATSAGNAYYTSAAVLDGWQGLFSAANNECPESRGGVKWLKQFLLQHAPTNTGIVFPLRVCLGGVMQGCFHLQFNWQKTNMLRN